MSCGGMFEAVGQVIEASSPDKLVKIQGRHVYLTGMDISCIWNEEGCVRLKHIIARTDALPGLCRFKLSRPATPTPSTSPNHRRRTYNSNDFICAVAPPAHHILLQSWWLFEEDRKGATIFKGEMWREALLITSVDVVVMVVRGGGGI